MEYCNSKAEELDTEQIEMVCEIIQRKLINTKWLMNTTVN